MQKGEWRMEATWSSCRVPHPSEEYGLSDLQSTDASDRAVDSRGVLVRTNDCLQHFWRWTC
jgi:hypothetical protein